MTLTSQVTLIVGFLFAYTTIAVYGMIDLYMHQNQWLPAFSHRMKSLSFRITFFLYYPIHITKRIARQ